MLQRFLPCLFPLLAGLACGCPATASAAATGGGAEHLPISTAPVPHRVSDGQLLREVTLHGLNGPSRRLSSYRGKPLIINVWASWCGPCREESASLERLAWSPLGASFAVIGISTDDYAENAQGWLRQSNATLNHYLDHQLEMETMLGADHLPLTVLVDADGRVLRRVTGAQEWDGAEAVRMIRSTFHLPPSVRLNALQGNEVEVVRVAIVGRTMDARRFLPAAFGKRREMRVARQGGSDFGDVQASGQR